MKQYIVSLYDRDGLRSALDEYWSNNEHGCSEIVMYNPSNMYSNPYISGVIAQYINDCFKPASERCFANIYNGSKESFVECVCHIYDYALYYRSKEWGQDSFNDNEFKKLDVFVRGLYARVVLPKELISEEANENLSHLGPDYLAGCFLGIENIFKYVLPCVLCELQLANAYDDPELNQLSKYKIGLA